MKREIKALKKMVASVMVGLILINSNPVFGATVYDSKVHEETITDGVTYSKVSKLTNAGNVDIYTLKIDLKNENTDLDILRSAETWGKREPLTKLITSNDAVAGVNASYFNMSYNASDIIGVEFDGELKYIEERFNKTKLETASLFLDADGNTSVDFLQSNTLLSNSKGETVRLTAYNSIFNAINMTIITTDYLKDSSSIEGLGNIYKFVVEDNVVTKIAEPKEVVVVPENGFILTVNFNGGEKMKSMFPVGEKMNLVITTTPIDNLDNMDMIITGGGLILKNGQPVLQGLLVEPNARHPRTAMGRTANDELVLMVVDGRGASVGATISELSGYLKEQGVVDAINLDGGGSSEMVLRPEGKTTTEIVNVPSDKSERKVVNGLGVVSTAPKGELNKIVVKPLRENLMVGEKTTIEIETFDQYKNPITVDKTLLEYIADGVTWEGNVLRADKEGIIKVEVKYGDVVGETYLTVSDKVVDLQINNDKGVGMALNSEASLNIVATDPFGNKIGVNPANITWVVEDAGIAYIQNGVIHSGGARGKTKVTANYKNVSKSFYVAVGDNYYSLTSFEKEEVTSDIYPAGVTGSATRISERPSDGSYSVKINYNFIAINSPQAVYAELKNVKLTNAYSSALSLAVMGDNSGNRIRATLVDRNGKEERVSFTDNINFTGYKTLEVGVPKGMAYPVTVKNLYVATSGSPKVPKGTVYLDNLKVKSPAEAALQTRDLLTADPLAMESGNNPSANLKIFGKKANIKNVSLANLNASNAVITNVADKNLLNGITAAKINYANGYSKFFYDGIDVITIGNQNGSVIKTGGNVNQWNALEYSLNNSNSDNIVVVGSKNPYKEFSNALERDLFTELLENCAKENGKNVYYISLDSSEFNVDYKNGVRYISLGADIVYLKLVGGVLKYSF